jgi:hypothetical protein
METREYKIEADKQHHKLKYCDKERSHSSLTQVAVHLHIPIWTAHKGCDTRANGYAR